MKRKLLSVVLAVAMVLTMMPMTALAEDKPFKVEGKSERYADLATAVEAAQSDKTITIVGPVTVDSKKDGETVKKLTANNAVVIAKGGSLTLNVTESDADLLSSIFFPIETQAGGEFTIKILGSTYTYFGGENARMNIKTGSITLSSLDKLTSGECKWSLSEKADVEVPETVKGSLTRASLQFNIGTNQYGVKLEIPENATLTVNGEMAGVSGSKPEKISSKLDVKGTLDCTNGTLLLGDNAAVSVSGSLLIGDAGIRKTSDTKSQCEKQDIISVTNNGSVSITENSLWKDKATTCIEAKSGTRFDYTDGNGNIVYGASTIKNPKAVIGGKPYSSLDGASGALDEAKSGDTITITTTDEVNIKDNSKGNSIKEGVTLVVPKTANLTIEQMAATGMMTSKGSLVVHAGAKVSLPDAPGDQTNVWVGNDNKARLKLTDGMVTVDFSTVETAQKPTATLKGTASTGTDIANPFRVQLGGKEIEFVINQDSVLTVPDGSTLLIPSYTNGSTVTVNGTLTVVKGGVVELHEKGKIHVSADGSLNIPVMTKADFSKMIGDITIDNGATLKVSNFPVLGSNGYLSPSAGTATINFGDVNTADTGSLKLTLTGAQLSINPTGSSHRDYITALLVAEDGNVPIDITLDNNTIVNIADEKTLNIPNGSKLNVAEGSTVNVNGNLEVHTKGKLTGNGAINVSGIAAVYGTTDSTFTLASGGKVLCDEDIEKQIVNGTKITNEADKNYDSVVSDVGSKSFNCGWQYKSTYNSPGSVGSSGSSGYSVQVDQNIEHGHVSVTPKSATAGKKVTVKVTPDEGYVLDELTVTDKDGNEITVNKVDENTFTFTMPKSRVTVSATFVEEKDSDIANKFTDVPAGEYYSDAVAWAVENGVTEGTSETTFSPDLGCSRAEIVTFLWRAAGSPEPENAGNSFTDVNTDAYYGKAVLWAVAEGITNGTGGTTFSPDATCTRAQIVTFLYRYEDTPSVSGTSFGDVPSGAYYANAVSWAVDEGVTKGTSETTFSPDNTCTRGQAVTFLYRDLAEK